MKRIPRSKTALVTVVGLSLVGSLAGCASTTSASSTDSGSTSATSTSDTSATYKDGTYTTDETFESPDGQDEIAVTVTVKDDVVTAASVTTVSSQGQSAQYQAQFESAISSVVVGKSLSTLSVSTVAGSSLASSAFNSALNTIRGEAS